MKVVGVRASIAVLVRRRSLKTAQDEVPNAKIVVVEIETALDYRYQSVWQTVGDGVSFQLNGNAGYTLAEAVQTLICMKRLSGVALFEQPVRYLDEMAVLATRLEAPLQAGGVPTDPRSAFEIAREKAAYVLHFKLHKFGGLLQAKRMSALAEAAGLELSVAPYFNILAAAATHFAVSTPNATWLAGASDMKDSLLVEPLAPQRQIMVPLERPGLGVALDRNKLTFYARRGV